MFIRFFSYNLFFMRAGFKNNLFTGLAMLISAGYLGLHLKDHNNDSRSNLVPYAESSKYAIIDGKVFGSTFRSSNGINYGFFLYVKLDSNRVSCHYFEINDPTDETFALIKPGTHVTFNNTGKVGALNGDHITILSTENLELALDSEFGHSK